MLNIIYSSFIYKDKLAQLQLYSVCKIVLYWRKKIKFASRKLQLKKLKVQNDHLINKDNVDKSMD